MRAFYEEWKMLEMDYSSVQTDELTRKLAVPTAKLSSVNDFIRCNE